MMKNVRTNVRWIAVSLSFLIAVSAIEVREQVVEHDVPSVLEASSGADPEDNGMAVGEAPNIDSLLTSESPLLTDTSHFAAVTITPLVDAVFPENHKNFTGSPYLGAIEPPPFLSGYNKYQKPYREYYAQKDQYASGKPVKFEENNSKNHFMNDGLRAFGESQSGSDMQLRNKPFPYLFEGAGEPKLEAGIQQSQHFQDSRGADNDNDLIGTGGDSTYTTPGTLKFHDNPFANLFGSQNNKHSSKEYVQENHSGTKHKSNGWNKAIRLLSAVIPLGLFLATLTPNILYINTTEDNRPSRLRSIEDDEFFSVDKSEKDDPLVQLVQRFGGIDAMDDPVCEDRFFCEMSILGQNEKGNVVEKGFWYLANETPDDMAEEVGMKELFQAIKKKSCDQFNCQPKIRNTSETKTALDKGTLLLKKPKKVKKFVRS